ncbi:type II toxin-antitoxin system RelE/ParE family toxin [Candidatus Daviesbacteria bacterium]|nr:type II toxin-antitoxin system RelE/ParE family toxin [Candidatus Daviesbacteria bacterium]
MQVIVTPEAQKQFNKLPRQTQAKIRKKLLLLEKDFLMGKKLEGELSNYRSVRAWPYRIIYFIEKSHSKVYVVSVAHRQGAYK